MSARQFLSAFQSMKTAYCLCDGLEIIASNDAFIELFGFTDQTANSLLLDKLLGEQNKVEKLFSMPGEAVEFNAINAPNGNELHLTASLHATRVGSSNAIIEFENRTDLHALQTKLANSQSIDPHSGALRIAAFETALQAYIATLSANSQHGLLVNVKIISSRSAEAPFRFEERGELLSDLVMRMTEEFGGECLIGRIDALALSLFMPSSNDVEEHNHVISQLRRITTKLITQDKQREELHDLGIRLGGAEFPTHGSDTTTLRKNAGLAQNSEQGNLFNHHLAEAEARRKALSLALPKALKSNTINPHFQPVINAKTNRLMGFEALVRWIHPELGYVIPPDIISIATSSGHLQELTASVMDAALNEVKKWPDNIHVAINVTPSQLNPQLIDLVRSKVHTSGVDPSRLEIEVTEEALIDNFDASAEIIARLRAIGVNVAMDDFGAGYTSIGNLRRLDFSKIKIDKSISDGLPEDPKTIAIVRSLMKMATELDVDVTVEGIETKEQVDFLRNFDCGIQGYFFSKPLPAEELTSFQQYL